MNRFCNLISINVFNLHSEDYAEFLYIRLLYVVFVYRAIYCLDIFRWVYIICIFVL